MTVGVTGTVPQVGIVALGAANTSSLTHAIHRAGGDARLVDRKEQLQTLDALVIPGVANVAFVLEALDHKSLRAPILDAIGRGLPTLGICAGFQLLFETSEEAPMARGLGVFDGAVTRLRGPTMPHMGWNRVESICTNVESGWAYFAHSFAVPANVAGTAALTEHGDLFASIVRRANVIGVQFHPERSARYGGKLLERFLSSANGLAGVG
jgi:glutamine amidotransferase